MHSVINENINFELYNNMLQWYGNVIEIFIENISENKKFSENKNKNTMTKKMQWE